MATSGGLWHIFDQVVGRLAWWMVRASNPLRSLGLFDLSRIFMWHTVYQTSECANVDETTCPYVRPETCGFLFVPETGQAPTPF